VNEQDSRAILTLSLMAAFADGDKHDRERAEVKRIAESLMNDEAVSLPALYQDVLMKRVALTQVAAQLSSPDAKQLAYEMAVCVCDADGAQSVPEQAFLRQLREALGLDAGAVGNVEAQAEAMATVPLAGDSAAVPASTPAAATSTANEAELDDAILRAAILNGALELLPETLSTMAIIPLQMKLVYRIGKAHGFELDSGHVKDFLATVGVGLTSQYLEQAGRKLLGGLLGKVGGGLLRGVGRQAVSSGMSFATTYALGHVAKRYYAGGRQLSGAMLKDAFSSLTQKAQGLHTQYLPQMQEQARTLDPAQLLQLVRRQP
jgi:uncharacterized protein (DUF697 family)/tellurite resistance protein